MERHGHLSLEPGTRNQLLSMSAATVDRLLRPVRDVVRQGRRRTGVNTSLRKSIAVRTFEDWNDPPPGYFGWTWSRTADGRLRVINVHS